MTSVWTSKEKIQLLIGLRKFGPTNLEALHQLVPSKTHLEIQLCCDDYAKAALNKNEQEGDIPPVKKWILLLKRLKKGTPNAVHDLIPRVLKYIALYEKRGGGSTTVNLSECYLVLSTMCRGLDSSELDDRSEYFLYECLTKLGKCLKYSECKATQKYIGKKAFLKDINVFQEPPDTRIEKHYLLNPLAVSTAYIKGSNNA